MDMSEGEWGIFVDGWDRYKRMTALVETEGIRDELRECCFLFPTPLGMNQVWRREGQTNTFHEVGGEQRKHVSAGSHNETPTPYCAAKVC